MEPKASDFLLAGSPQIRFIAVVMTATAPFPLVCLCLVGASLSPLVGMSLEEAGAALGDESYQVREQAEQVIRLAGMADYDQVQQFSQSANPEIAIRARRSLPIILLGIDGQIPPDFAEKLRHIDDLSGRQLEPIATELASLKPTRLVTLIGLHSYWRTAAPATSEVAGELLATLEKAIVPALRGETALTDLHGLRAGLYHTNTLATVINGLCKSQQGDLTPLLPLLDAWAKVHASLPTLLNADGYRLELCRMATRAPDRSDALRDLLNLGTNGDLTPVQAEAVRRQLAEYKDDAASFPVSSLDKATGWYFFTVLGNDQTGKGYLDAYREYRKRFPVISETILLAQPLEVLLVLEKSGPCAAMDYAYKETNHGGVMLLAEYLHAQPELIREPLPLPELKDKQPYPYRPLKFLRIFAPYATDAEMRNHPEIAAAFDILAKDPHWNDVAKQARPLIAEQQATSPK